jgi:hypothetical protein
LVEPCCDLRTDIQAPPMIFTNTGMDDEYGKYYYDPAYLKSKIILNVVDEVAETP